MNSTDNSVVDVVKKTNFGFKNDLKKKAKLFKS